MSTVGIIAMEGLRRCLGENRPRLTNDDTARAAVAVIVRAGPAEVELLFILRAKHASDPWSGHMAFPGGRVDVSDLSPLDAAIRETVEEIDLDLRTAACQIGRLSDVRAIARGKPLPLVIEPYVFELVSAPGLTANEEVEEILWVPLAFLADRANRERMIWRGRGVPVPLPCYYFEGRLIWGLTLQMVDDLLACLAG